MGGRILRLLAFVCGSLLVGALPAASAPPRLTIVSVGPDGFSAKGSSLNPSLSADGRFVAFASHAADLVRGDTNDVPDVFLRDMRTGRTTRISVGAGGRQDPDGSIGPSITADGRWISYCRGAAKTAARPGWLVYVYDRVTRSTTLASVDVQGRPAPSTMEFCGQAIAQGGRYVLIWSDAANLVRRDRNKVADVFVRDLRLHRTRLVATSPRGVQATYEVDPGGISADGRYVTFCTTSQNLLPHRGDLRSPQVYLKDLKTGKLRYASTTPGGSIVGRGACGWHALSADGRWVVFTGGMHELMPGVDNTWLQLWLKDLRTGRVQFVTPGTTGHGITWSLNLVRISANGRFVIFVTGASDVLPGLPSSNGSQVYRYDRVTRKTELLSVTLDGKPEGAFAVDDGISPDGKSVAFVSDDEYLAPHDGNGELDVFLARP